MGFLIYSEWGGMFQPPPLEESKYKDEWPSGLRQRFTKPPTLNRVREFESHLIRQYKNERP